MPRTALAPLLLAVVLLAGCAAAIVQAPGVLYYRCEDGVSFSARFESGGEAVLLRLPGGTRRLEHVPSGSGARYSDGATTLWTQGREAMLEEPGGRTHRGCTAR